MVQLHPGLLSGLAGAQGQRGRVAGRAASQGALVGAMVALPDNWAPRWRAGGAEGRQGALLRGLLWGGGALAGSQQLQQCVISLWQWRGGAGPPCAAWGACMGPGFEQEPAALPAPLTNLHSPRARR